MAIAAIRRAAIGAVMAAVAFGVVVATSPTASAAPADEICSQAEGNWPGATSTDSIPLRSGPGADFSVTGTSTWDFKVDSCVVNSAGHHWFHGKTTDGRTGWVWAE
ncbi:hypothetical protein AV521_31630 [Streptomyces sp. IMTB 2501]|uniref:SH3 domain-containing protein n=1 Tax=Streptomyces sp. IMTB 2501 TaxID=1776340 RepID=UPI00096BF017|nr:SH3 domain-containing protein [Streptomyces sp. IMTB 2501]OLZ65592.1 hypothetical protein AV521_31630 [Streptomyces sp. IMTB 2501]